MKQLFCSTIYNLCADTKHAYIASRCSYHKDQDLKSESLAVLRPSNFTSPDCFCKVSTGIIQNSTFYKNKIKTCLNFSSNNTHRKSMII